MSIRILSLQLNGNERDADFQVLSDRLPDAVRERTHKYKAPQEKNRRVAGKALLMKALRDWGIAPEAAMERLRYTATQQPYLEGLDIHLSISHSEELIVCAVARNAAIGVDVEKIKPVKLSLMKAYLDAQTWQEIIDAGDPEMMFFTHWTIREAAIKTSGLGLEHVDLAGVKSNEDTIELLHQKFYYKVLNISHTHAACIASNVKIDEVEIVPQTFKDLL